MRRPLIKATVYFTEDEYQAFKAIAEDEAVTISAVLRAKLGLGYQRRGAPQGNSNRRGQSKTTARADKDGLVTG
jgi:hypothetical protein